MKRYYMFIAPKDGEPYRFVAGFRRHWLLWKTVEYCYVPVTVSVNDYAELDGLTKAAERETGRGVKVCLSDKMDECCGDNMYWALHDKDGGWYTGRFFSKDRYGKAQVETSKDFLDSEFYAREHYAKNEMLRCHRMGHTFVMERVYVNIMNIFLLPCIVTLCVNKRTKEVRYLKTFDDNTYRLRYTDNADDAFTLYPEEIESFYEKLCTLHKDTSFTMVVKPRVNIPARELRKREKELCQRISCCFHLKSHEADNKKQH